MGSNNLVLSDIGRSEEFLELPGLISGAAVAKTRKEIKANVTSSVEVA